MRHSDIDFHNGRFINQMADDPFFHGIIGHFNAYSFQS